MNPIIALRSSFVVECSLEVFSADALVHPSYSSLNCTVRPSFAL